MPPQTPIIIRTIGDLLANPDHGLTAHCPACQHFAALDLRRLVERFGGDVEPRELNPLLRCRNCDHKGCEIQINTMGYKPH